mgnify:CR=1 FL=1
MTCCRGSGDGGRSTWLDQMEPGRLGTYCSYFLLGLGIFVSIVLQQTYAQSVDIWTNGCDEEEDFKDECMRNSAVFRFSMALSVVFGIHMIGTYMYPPFYDNMWVPKFSLFFVLVILFSFLDSDIFNDDGFAWFARIAGFFFVIIQQVILLDFAYLWNEKWVSYATDNGGEDGSEIYLYGLLGFSASLFIGSIIAIAFMYQNFECSEATGIITMTLVFTMASTLFQVFFTEHGSLLTSAIVTAYATFLCYSSISLNPNSDCNPTISDYDQDVTRVVGSLLAALTISYTTYATVEKSKELRGAQQDPFLKRPPGPEGEEQSTVPARARDSESDEDGKNNEGSEVKQGYTEDMKKLLTEVACIFLLVSCYFAMVITNWATEQRGGDSSNPTNGNAAMWLQATAQWIALVLYAWTLVAPTIWPDRDFSGAQV